MVTSSTVVRPASFDSFIGQEQAVKQLRVAVNASKAREMAMGHALLLGPAGLGKTTLGCSVVPNEMGVPAATYVNCSAIEKTTDLLPVLTTQKAGSILFMDEIHALIPAAKEYMLSLLEDSRITVSMGNGSNDLMTIDLPKFTVIAATTRPAALSEPLRDRFMHIVNLTPYTDDQIAQIIVWHSSKRGVEALCTDVHVHLAPLCRGTARHAVRFVESCIDTIYADNLSKFITKPVVAMTLERLGYIGNMTPAERKVLTALSKAKDCRLGLNSLAAQVDEEPGTVESIIEPWLLQQGYVVRELKGRVLTDLGKKQLC